MYFCSIWLCNLKAVERITALSDIFDGARSRARICGTSSHVASRFTHSSPKPMSTPRRDQCLAELRIRQGRGTHIHMQIKSTRSEAAAVSARVVQSKSLTFEIWIKVQPAEHRPSQMHFCLGCRCATYIKQKSQKLANMSEWMVTGDKVAHLASHFVEIYAVWIQMSHCWPIQPNKMHY